VGATAVGAPFAEKEPFKWSYKNGPYKGPKIHGVSLVFFDPEISGVYFTLLIAGAHVIFALFQKLWEGFCFF